MTPPNARAGTRLRVGNRLLHPNNLLESVQRVPARVLKMANFGPQVYGILAGIRVPPLKWEKTQTSRLN